MRGDDDDRRRAGGGVRPVGSVEEEGGVADDDGRSPRRWYALPSPIVGGYGETKTETPRGGAGIVEQPQRHRRR
jgi:hypothetical protein